MWDAAAAAQPMSKSWRHLPSTVIYIHQSNCSKSSRRPTLVITWNFFKVPMKSTPVIKQLASRPQCCVCIFIVACFFDRSNNARCIIIPADVVSVNILKQNIRRPVKQINRRVFLQQDGAASITSRRKLHVYSISDSCLMICLMQWIQVLYSTSIRRPFDYLSEVIKVTVT